MKKDRQNNYYVKQKIEALLGILDEIVQLFVKEMIDAFNMNKNNLGWGFAVFIDFSKYVINQNRIRKEDSLTEHTHLEIIKKFKRSKQFQDMYKSSENIQSSSRKYYRKTHDDKRSFNLLDYEIIHIGIVLGYFKLTNSCDKTYWKEYVRNDLLANMTEDGKSFDMDSTITALEKLSDLSSKVKVEMLFSNTLADAQQFHVDYKTALAEYTKDEKLRQNIMGNRILRTTNNSNKNRSRNVEPAYKIFYRKMPLSGFFACENYTNIKLAKSWNEDNQTLEGVTTESIKLHTLCIVLGNQLHAGNEYTGSTRSREDDALHIRLFYTFIASGFQSNIKGDEQYWFIPNHPSTSYKTGYTGVPGTGSLRATDKEFSKGKFSWKPRQKNKINGVPCNGVITTTNYLLVVVIIVVILICSYTLISLINWQ